MTRVAGLPKPQAPVNLDEALAGACEGVEGITSAQFRALLSPEDIEDIAAGGIHPKTLHATPSHSSRGSARGEHDHEYG